MLKNIRLQNWQQFAHSQLLQEWNFFFSSVPPKALICCFGWFSKAYNWTIRRS